MMKAMVLPEPGMPLEERALPVPEPGPGQLLLKVLACGVCRTDLHVVDGDLTEPKRPIIPGHEIIARVVAVGEGVPDAQIGRRMGVPWLGHACGQCRYCQEKRENLCDAPGFTGYQIDGGYAEYTVADTDFCFPVPDIYGAVEAAPLLCAGLIGFRSYRMAGDARRLGLYGFGAAAHILVQLARHQGREIYAFTREGDTQAQDFAREMGSVWVGGSNEAPPEELDAAIIFAAAGPLLPAALKAVRKGGMVVCGGIHMSDIPSFPYSILWEERSIRSVANLTRQDGIDFMKLSGEVRIETHTHAYPLSEANRALDDLRAGRFTGAAVLVP